MRVFLGIASLAIAASFWTPAAEAGCSVRGRYCNYPTWAANAFEGRAGRVVDQDSDRRVRVVYTRARHRR